jgi:hypothetical protein
MPRGRPAKKQKNISGLRGQYRRHSSTSEPSSVPYTSDNESCYQRSDGSDSEANQDITTVFDGLKIQFEQEYMKAEDADGSDIDHELEMNGLDDEDFGCRLAEMMHKEDERDRSGLDSRLAETKGAKTRR